MAKNDQYRNNQEKHGIAYNLIHLDNFSIQKQYNGEILGTKVFQGEKYFLVLVCNIYS